MSLERLGSEISTLDELRAVMRAHGLAVRKAPPLPWDDDLVDHAFGTVSNFAVWELHFDAGRTYGDGLEVDLDDPLHEPEWQAMRAALCALDLWEHPGPRAFLGHP